MRADRSLTDHVTRNAVANVDDLVEHGESFERALDRCGLVRDTYYKVRERSRKRTD